MKKNFFLETTKIKNTINTSVKQNALAVFCSAFLKTVFCALIFLSLGNKNSYAVLKTWVNGAAGGAWTTGANWSGGTIPLAADEITINPTAAIVITAVPTLSIADLTIGAGAGTSVTLQSGAAATLTITNGTGTDFSVPLSAALIIGDAAGGFALTVVNTAASSVGAIAGTLTVTGLGAFTGALLTTTFAAGSVYNHARNGGTIPTATWNVTSTCNITGITTTNPTGFIQTFGNFTWNNAGQTTATGAINGAMTVAGALTVTAGALNFNAFTVTAAGGNVTNSGTITTTSANSRLTMAGVAAQTISGAGTWTTGTAGRLLNLTINNTAGVTLSSALAIQTNLTLQAGALTSAVLTIGIPATAVNTIRTAGSLTNAPTWGFTTGAYTVTYNGGAAISTGNELPASTTPTNGPLAVTVASTNVTLTNNVNISNLTTALASNTFNLGGFTLGLSGATPMAVATNPGTITANGAGSTLLFNGTVNQTFNSPGTFTGTLISNVVIDNSNTASTGLLWGNAPNIGTLTVNASRILSVWGVNVNITGNVINNGIINSATAGSAIAMLGTVAQTISGTGTWTTVAPPSAGNGRLAGLTINNTSGAPTAVSVNVSVPLEDALTLTAGTLGGSGTLTIGAPGLAFLTTRTAGSLLNVPLFNYTTGAYAITYNGGAAISTGNELPVSTTAPTNGVLTVLTAGTNVTLTKNANIGTLTTSVATTTTFNLNGFTLGLSLAAPLSNTGVITANAAASTLLLNGAVAQSLNTNAGAYTGNLISNLIIDNSSTGVSLGSPQSATLGFTNVTINATRILNLNTETIRIAGTYTNNGSLTGSATNSNITLNGSAAQTFNIGTYSGSLLNEFVINNAAGVTLTAPLNVSGIFTLTAGTLTTTAANLLTVTATTVGSVVGGSTTAYVNGPLARALPTSLVAGSTYAFPIGKSAYQLFEMVNPTCSSGGTYTLTVESFDANSGGTGDPATGVCLNINRYWSAIPSGTGTLSSSGQIRLTESGLANGNNICHSSTQTGTYLLYNSSVAAPQITSDVLTVMPSAMGYYVIGRRPPLVDFSADNTNPTTATLVTFTDQSLYAATVWAWDVDGNGTTDYATQNPTHTYATAGVYTVKLTASNACGSGGSKTKLAYITVTAPGTLTPKGLLLATGTYASHSLAVCGDGSVKSWGDGGPGFGTTCGLGRGTSGNFMTYVGPVWPGGFSAIAVSAGTWQSFALLSNGTVAAWGDNANGELGNGTTTDNFAPTPANAIVLTGAAATLTGIVAVSAGNLGGYALKSDGTVWAWGSNTVGQCGQGNTTSPQLYAVQVLTAPATPLTGVVAISGGGGYCLALRNNGTVWAWGENSLGQCGDGTTTDNLYAEQVQSAAGPTYLTGIIAVSAGAQTSMALRSNGTIATWGNNWISDVGSGGALWGDGTTTNSQTSYANKTVLDYTGATLSGVVSISAGSKHLMALKGNGTVWAWGYQYRGRIGDGTSSSSGFYPRAVQVKDVGGNGPLTGIISISAGNLHSLALKEDYTGVGWGVSGSGCVGCLGDETQNTYTTPIIIPNLCNPTFVSSSNPSFALGASHTLFICGVGDTVKSWGLNTNGQLGNGSTTQSSTAVNVSGLSGSGIGVFAVAAGGAHSLALMGDGTVKAWGAGASGQCGDGLTTANNTTAVNVTGLTNVIAIAAGGNHSMALKDDGTVWAWGLNTNGQLGDGTTTQRNTPVQVAFLGYEDIAAISAGGSHSLALRENGTVMAWGAGASGQCGNGLTTANNLVPVTVQTAGGVGLRDITKISAGNLHNAALRSDGTAWAWGSHSNGQCGDGSAAGGQKNYAVQVSGLTGIIAVSAGNSHSIALKDDATVRAWGAGGSGQCGNGLTTASNTSPVTVSVITTALAVAAGGSHNMALGSVFTWGLNTNGQLGNGNTTQQNSPVTINCGCENVRTNPTIVRKMAAGTASTYLINSNGELMSVGWDGWNGAVSPTYSGALGLGSNTVCCTGDGTTATPDKVVGQGGVGLLTNVIAVRAAGVGAGYGTPAIALRRDGTVWAWGSDYNASLGQGNPYIYTSVSVPVKVQGLDNVIAIAGDGGGSGGFMALKSDGTVWKWGNDASGSMDIDELPNQVNGPGGAGYLERVVAIDLFGGTSPSGMALRADGTVWTWGDGSSGQLGNGTWTASQATPVQVLGVGGVGFLTDIVMVAGGYDHVLALKRNGTMVSWGDNTWKQLGQGNGSIANTNVPVEVWCGDGPPTTQLTGVTMIAAGMRYSMVTLSDGTMRSWGNGGQGQLGDGTFTGSAPITTVSGLGYVTDMDAGDYYAIALCDGVLMTWGADNKGQLGDGTIASPANTNVPAASLFAPLAATGNGCSRAPFDPCAPAPLPVEWLSFSASEKAGDVLLNWKTASEINSDYFEVQRGMATGTDINATMVWTIIGTVKAAGNSSAIKRYDFLDKEPPVSILYYRLRQVDYNGDYKYSPMVSIAIGDIQAFNFIAVLQEDGGENMSLVFEIPEPRSVQISVHVQNITGQMILQKDLGSFLPGYHWQKINISALAGGTYFIRLRAGSEEKIRKLVVIKNK